ncbi:dienelactone hydrolase family protein [Fontivita pretiosa]|uniref:dienelactone hydrolase family protein n=1 Tax=Fontivita pretiosa TaxID=2989684 RepID=UPI003D185E91
MNAAESLRTGPGEISESVRIPASADGSVQLEGDLIIPEPAEQVRGVVLFAHGSGSSRFSRRNRYVAQRLRQAQLATLLMDLLTADEEAVDQQTAELRFDIDLLAERLVWAIDFLLRHPRTLKLPVGLFGASTGAAAALVAAAQRADVVGAVVSRGGRPDLAARALPKVRCPTLLIVGGEDDIVIDLNHRAMRLMNCPARLEIIPGAGHLFEEPGALDQVARLARDWFARHLRPGDGGVMARGG